jgi:glycosyltransferase involved in cell wall biosynthesis
MKLLFVVPYAPTPIRVRPFQFLRALAQRGHHIMLLTLLERADEQPSLEALRALGIDVRAWPLTRAQKIRNVSRAIVSGDPLQARYCWHTGLAKALDAELASENVDALHVEHLRGSRYAERAMGRARIVWDSVDSITHLFEQSARHSLSPKMRLITALELPRTRRAEARLARGFARTLVTSHIDATALRALAGASAPLSVISNGVDLDAFSPGTAVRAQDTLIFTGKMSYHANITAVLHFCKSVLPGIWRERPATVLRIVGKDPAPQVLALAQQFPGRVLVEGAVPDLAERLRCASIAIAPIVYGAGIQNKVLEAMATATPVVASRSAVSALHPDGHAALRIADDDAQFAQHVLELLANEAQRAELGQAGRRFVERHHNWASAAEALEAIYVG